MNKPRPLGHKLDRKLWKRFYNKVSFEVWFYFTHKLLLLVFFYFNFKFVPKKKHKIKETLITGKNLLVLLASYREENERRVECKEEESMEKEDICLLGFVD